MRTEPVTGAGGTPRRTPWLARRPHPPGAAVGLYCFPHAGGAPGEYVRWAEDLPGARVAAVQAPGRASRLFEPPFTRMTELVDAVAESVPFDPPFVFFGHSLGALVAFEVARTLRARGGPGPDRLIVSACPAPPAVVTGPELHRLPDRKFLAEIERNWGPLPAGVQGDPDLLALTLTCFRADLEVLETYRYAPGDPLGCPVTAIGGSEDPHTAVMDEWRHQTTGPFDRHVLPGGHFYFRERRHEVLRLVHESISDDPGRETPRG
jgi:surfactin synthase thioesterase subunit